MYNSGLTSLPPPRPVFFATEIEIEQHKLLMATLHASGL